MEELAGFGARVHTCDRDQTPLDECLSEWQTKGFQVTGSVCDVSSQPQRDQLMKTVSSLFSGKLNILVKSSSNNLLFALTICENNLKQSEALIIVNAYHYADKQCWQVHIKANFRNYS